MAWVERILRDYPDTGAATKARQRLGVAEEAVAPAEEADAPEPESDASEPESNLPKGFTSKKR